MHKRNTRTSERRASKTRGTTDAVEILHKLLFEGHPARLASLEEEKANLQIARKIYDLRAAAGLSQRELAKRVGTTASVICRLEDADYEGHSLGMLRRIAAAMDRRLEIRFVRERRPAGGKTASNKPRTKSASAGKKTRKKKSA